MKEKILSDEIEELIHGNFPLSVNDSPDKEYDEIKAELSLPDCGIEIEPHQKGVGQQANPTEKQYEQEKTDLQKMADDDIIILREHEGIGSPSEDKNIA